jgi:hypothetical protein
VRFECVPVHVPKDGVERGRTGGGVGEAERLRDACAIMASPCGDGTLGAHATQHRTTRQREDGGSRMALATRLPQVGYGREHFNERMGRCYHQAPPLVRVVAQVGDTGQAEPHCEHNPLSPLGVWYAIPIRNLNDAALC